MSLCLSHSFQLFILDKIELSADKSLKIVFNKRSLFEFWVIAWKAFKEMSGIAMTSLLPHPLHEQDF